MANQDSISYLYNNQHTAQFKNSTHRYYIDGTLKPGVTTIMGRVLAKPDLMLWPLNMAMRYLEEALDKSPVGITRADLDEARKAHIKRRDSGASTGTIVHDLVESRLLNLAIDSSTQPEEVIKALSAFDAWHATAKPITIAVEQVVYSPTLEYAGTFDSILKIGDKNYLCDLKTTNSSRSSPKGIYAEYFIQLGAYLYAYDEQRNYELQHGGTQLVPIDDLLIISCKKDGQLDTCAASELGLTPNECMEMWFYTFQLHNSLSKLKKQLGGNNG